MSKKPASRKYSQGDNLQKALSAAKIKSPGKVATILLDAFVGGVKITASMLYEKKICVKRDPENNFEAWRKELRDKNFLCYERPDGKESRCFDGYSEGSKLVKYTQREILALNKLKFRSEELATMKDIEKQNKRIAELERQMRIMAKNHVNLTNPPSDEIKENNYLELIRQTF